jgi:hypothetical protein
MKPTARSRGLRFLRRLRRRIFGADQALFDECLRELIGTRESHIEIEFVRLAEMLLDENHMRRIDQAVDDAELVEGNGDPDALVNVMILDRRNAQRLRRRFAICAGQSAGTEFHAAIPADDDNRDVVQVRAFDRAEDRLAGGAGRLARVGAARANAAIREEPEGPTEMRGVVVTFRQRGELREKRVLRLDMEGDAEELGAIDLLPELGRRGEALVMVSNGCNFTSKARTPRDADSSARAS